MTPPTTTAEPACPDSADPSGTHDEPSPTPQRTLRVEQVAVDGIDRRIWDGLASRNPWATPFSSWGFHRAWWDAYGANAHDETLVVSDGDEPIAIAPLMHRHEIEPGDLEVSTRMRQASTAQLTPVPDSATAIFFGASYHADYATLLCGTDDLPRVADAMVEHLRATEDERRVRWDAVDLRRLRCGDPAAEALAGAFGRREMDADWTLNLEREDVCPVVTLPDGASLDDYLATLGKKARHEIRRKWRRAEAVGEIRLDDSADPLVDLEPFIELHQKRWGGEGLFPATEGGRQSRVFFRRMFELLGGDGPLKLAFLSVGGRRIATGIHFETPEAALYYNAGVDPDARELSPGVVMTAAYVRRALERRIRRLDFLRGDEPYKYEWGAVDEPIQRLLVRRTESR